jgi:mRNA export factor
MSFFSNAATSGVASATSQGGDKDVELADPPTDSISSLSFSGQADYLAVGSWDNSVRLLSLMLILLNVLFNHKIRCAFMRSV